MKTGGPNWFWLLSAYSALASGWINFYNSSPLSSAAKWIIPHCQAPVITFMYCIQLLALQKLPVLLWWAKAKLMMLKPVCSRNKFSLSSQTDSLHVCHGELRMIWYPIPFPSLRKCPQKERRKKNLWKQKRKTNFLKVEIAFPHLLWFVHKQISSRFGIFIILYQQGWIDFLY